MKFLGEILNSNNVITKVVYKDMLVGMQNGQKNWASNMVFPIYGSIKNLFNINHMQC